MKKYLPGGFLYDPETGLVFRKNDAPINTRKKGYISLDTFAHRLIWEAYHGPLPKGLVINHKNGIKADNRLENLELVTSGENTQHAHRTGLIRNGNRGESNGSAKINYAQAEEIRRLSKAGVSTRKIAALFEIKGPQISNIVNNKYWKKSNG